MRIAGANVGTVKDVTVTNETEPAHADGSPDPARPLSSCRSTTRGSRTSAQDASCLIRPQSLLGEKYVECKPTEPRAPGSPAPPPLEVIADDEPGAGERLLPRRVERQRRRPRPRQQHHARALRGPLPADHQLARRQPRRARRRPRARSSTAPIRRCARPTGSSRSSPSRTTRSPSWHATATRCSTPLARDRERIGSFINGAARPTRRPRSAGRTSSATSRCCRRRCARCARRWSS